MANRPERVHALVAGSGVAGLSFALHAASAGRVIVCSRGALDDGSTARAQGGIAAVVYGDDTFDAHVDDTLRVGAGLSREDVVRMVVSDAPRAIALLQTIGVPFDRAEDGALDRALEGGHGARRVLHVRDATGRAVHSALLAAARAHPQIELRESAPWIGLRVEPGADGGRMCRGADVADPATGTITSVEADATVLATGGAGGLWTHTSNPEHSVGHGLALAWRAGAAIVNAEFVQFHPTLLALPGADGFLITEALRGQGAVLRRQDGAPLMDAIDPRGSLASRDIISRAIAAESVRTGTESVWLDATGIEAEQLAARFPTVLARCVALGVDPRTEWLPVAPGAHYLCGGVDVDPWGRTGVGRLFAIGEVAHTGVHGACRLASNSLAEALVFAARAAWAVDELGSAPARAGMVAPVQRLAPSTGAWSGLRDRMRRAMSAGAGVLRTADGLTETLRVLERIDAELAVSAFGRAPTFELLELQSAVQAARLIAASALSRTESRGVHWRSDFPETAEVAVDTRMEPATG